MKKRYVAIILAVCVGCSFGAGYFLADYENKRTETEQNSNIVSEKTVETGAMKVVVYDEEDRILKETFYSDGQITGWSEYSYEVLYEGEEEEVFQEDYDAEGKLIHEVEGPFGYWEAWYEYDEEGRLIRRKAQADDGTGIEKVFDDNGELIEENEYVAIY